MNQLRGYNMNQLSRRSARPNQPKHLPRGEWPRDNPNSWSGTTVDMTNEELGWRKVTELTEPSFVARCITHWRRQAELGGPDTFLHCADELENALELDREAEKP
jgi:hypothetical protein